MLIFEVVTIVSIGLLIGTELAVSVFINPILARLDERTRAQAIQMFATRLGKAMPPWYVASFVLLLALTWLNRHQSGQSLLIASVIWAVVILLTILFLVPINNRMMRLDPNSFTETQQREHRRWTTLHHLRVLALCIAMVCLLLATLPM